MLVRPALAALTTTLSAGALALTALATAGPSAALQPAPEQRAAAVADPAAACDAAPSARVRKGARRSEPKLYQDANAYGTIKDRPTLAAGSVDVETVFHVITDQRQSAAERARSQQMVGDQVDVLNEAFGGGTAADAADTPFRFSLTDTTYTVNRAWDGTPGTAEKEMKKALQVGDSETLNVYATDLGGGLLGYAYFPKGYNKGQSYLDGVVILDESMPGGTAEPYAEGDTLTHEVGHWLQLEHTFAGACSARGDGVDDTPREAVPQFGCPVGADTCAAPGLDPVHNFMDYSVDDCMNMFTRGQSARMSDAWLAFRAGGAG